MVMHPNEIEDADDEIDEGTNEEHISIDKCVSLTEKLVKGLEQKSFISEQHVMWVYKIQEVLQTNKLKCMKQLTLQDMFKKVEYCSADKNDNSGFHCSTSCAF
jgi:hypothetical protein